MERSRSARYRDGVVDADPAGKLHLEPLEVLPGGGDPVRVERVEQ